MIIAVRIAHHKISQLKVKPVFLQLSSKGGKMLSNVVLYLSHSWLNMLLMWSLSTKCSSEDWSVVRFDTVSWVASILGALM